MKRIILLAGHYGSGKTNLAVNIAMALKKSGKQVRIADLDIVNPYYRTKDSEQELKEAGITLISSRFANSNVDLPSLPQEIAIITEDRSSIAVVDVGGDDRGALALGRLAPAIREEDDYEMLFVFNAYRPLTRTAEEALEVLREIEAAAKLRFTGILHNSNLGRQTVAEDILSADKVAKELSALSGLPIVATAAMASLAGELSCLDTPILPLTLQNKRIYN